MTRIKTLILAAALTALSFGGSTAQDRAFTIAIPLLPISLGNPLAVGGFPQLLVWPVMFDTLVELDETGTFQPSLALSWRAETPTTWVFELREGVTFSNGEPFDAAAAKGTFDFLLTEAGRRMSSSRDIQSVADTRVRGPYTLEIATSRPDATLPGKLAGVWMLPPRYLAQVGEDGFARAPHGTGPFRAEAVSSSEFRLAAYDGAWQRARLERLNLKALPDTTSRVQALISGAVDIAFDVGLDDLETIEAAGGRIDYRKRASVEVWQFITELPSPLQDARVRMALNIAIDRQRIVDALLRGKTRIATQFTAHDVFGFDPDLPPFPFDPARAKQLLAEAGFPNGLDLTFQVSADGPSEAAVYQQVASDLAAVGARITVRRVTRQQIQDGVYNGKWIGVAFNMNYGSLPAFDPLAALRYHSCSWPTPWVCRPEISALMKDVEAEFDVEKRRAIIRTIMGKLRADPPGLALFENIHPDGLGPRVAGYRAPFGFVRYHELNVTD
ncbi:MAG: ABC transporter substrate-binding protein [Rhodospirillaceae bacterium]|nr:ABC transporter substrate-binding protein [Rhodospirillaceae bacterium]